MHMVDATHQRHNELAEDLMYCIASSCHEICTHNYLCNCCETERKNSNGCSKEEGSRPG